MEIKKAVYVTSKIDGKEYCKTNGHFTKHLRSNNITYRDYFEKFITNKIEQCPYCDKGKTFYQSDESYATTCGDPFCVGKQVSSTKLGWTDEKRESDSANKKVAASKKTPETLRVAGEKRKSTNLKKFGVEHTSRSPIVKNKSKQTKLARYSNEYYSNWDASAKKNRNKTTEEQHLINEKRRETNVELFGVGCIFLKPEIRAKSAKSNSNGKPTVKKNTKVDCLIINEKPTR